MKLNKNLFPVIVILSVFSLLSCEKDFNTIGNDIIGTPTFNTEPYVSEVIAYNEKIEAVQTSSLPLYLLGTYTDPFYGATDASILTQLSLPVGDPDFGLEPVVDSVVMVLPYFSTITEQNNQSATYELDSIYGNGDLKIAVYESNYFLRDLDPETNFEENQLYYSNQMPEFENNLGQMLAETTITPNNDEVTVYQYTGLEKDTLKLSPRIRLHLPVDFFQQKIIDKQDSQELLTNANFKNYFRGLYLKAENTGNNSMAAFDFAADQAKVIIYFTRQEIDPTSETEETIDVHKVFELKIQGNTVNVFSDNFPVDLSTQDTINGEANLYLKGGQGSIATIKLFDGPDTDEDGVSDELEMLREEDWLINEANLTFVVNDALSPGENKEPQRVFIYDMESNKVLIDYRIDFTASESQPATSRILHLGALSTKDNGDRYYKIRITGLIRSIINLDSTNVKLGLTVAANVNLNSLAKLKNAEEEVPSAIPATSVVSPRGTVLYGNNTPIVDKQLKLNIFYTKPE